MGFIDTFFRRTEKAVSDVQPETKSASPTRPVYTRIGPGRAVTTPRRYDRLAVEGYQNNVIAFRAINLVARGVASIPLKLFSHGQAVDTHPLFWMLMKSPNPRQKGTRLPL